AVVTAPPAVDELRLPRARRSAAGRDDLVVEVDEVRRALEVHEALVREPRADLVVDAALGLELLYLANARLGGIDGARDPRWCPPHVQTGEHVGPGRPRDHADPGNDAPCLPRHRRLREVQARLARHVALEE